MTVIADVFEHCVYCETSLPRATREGGSNTSMTYGRGPRGALIIYHTTSLPTPPPPTAQSQVRISCKPLHIRVSSLRRRKGVEHSFLRNRHIRNQRPSVITEDSGAVPPLQPLLPNHTLSWEAEWNLLGTSRRR
ncbi:hypothetical protein J6590_067805 [Homalodisca vitripennis]|nr:hypothetical protein J6590_067805 [Homalodisca vitripennis]